MGNDICRASDSRRWRPSGATLLWLLLLPPSCNDGGGPARVDAGRADSRARDARTDQKVTPRAAVMAVHAASDAPAIRLEIGNVRVADRPLELARHSRYVAVPSGSQQARVRRASDDTVLLEQPLTLEADQAYSLFVADRAAELELIMLPDDRERPETYEAALRLVQMSPDAGALTLSTGAGLALFAGEAVSFGEGSRFETVEVGSFDQLTLARNDETLLTRENELEELRVYTLLVYGQVADGSLATTLLPNL
jgi:hypothetical protein